MLEEGEGIIDGPDENMFLEDGIHASVWGKGGREGGREG